MSPTATPSLCMEDENTNTIIINIMFYSIMTTSMCGLWHQQFIRTTKYTLPHMYWDDLDQYYTLFIGLLHYRYRLHFARSCYVISSLLNRDSELHYKPVNPITDSLHICNPRCEKYQLTSTPKLYSIDNECHIIDIWTTWWKTISKFKKPMHRQPEPISLFTSFPEIFLWRWRISHENGKLQVAFVPDSALFIRSSTSSKV